MGGKFVLTSSAVGSWKMTARRRPDASEEAGTRPAWAAAPPASGPSVRPRILLAEDDAEMRALLVWSLRRQHYDVTECVDGLDLVSKLGTFVLFGEPAGFDLVISDIRMPGASALEIVEAMRECEGLPPVILITGFGDARTHEEAQRLGVAAVFDKPFEIRDLLAKARELIVAGRARVPRGRTPTSLPAAETGYPADRGASPSGSVSEGRGESSERKKP